MLLSAALDSWQSNKKMQAKFHLSLEDYSAVPSTNYIRPGSVPPTTFYCRQEEQQASKNSESDQTAVVSCDMVISGVF